MRCATARCTPDWFYFWLCLSFLRTSRAQDKLMCSWLSGSAWVACLPPNARNPIPPPPHTQTYLVFISQQRKENREILGRHKLRYHTMHTYDTLRMYRFIRHRCCYFPVMSRSLSRLRPIQLYIVLIFFPCRFPRSQQSVNQFMSVCVRVCLLLRIYHLYYYYYRVDCANRLTIENTRVAVRLTNQTCVCVSVC